MRTALLLVLSGLLLGACATSDEPPPAASNTPSADQAEQSAASSPLDAYYDQPLSWGDCGKGAQCATFEVPLDYDDPDGDRIEIAVLRVPAADPTTRIGSLVVNPGGPGASGIDYAAAADVVVSDRVHEVYDVVGFDPRGVGRSTPMECVSDAELDASLGEADGTPETPAEVAALVQGAAEFAEGCQTQSGDLLPHVGTADVARDLDVLRHLLGDATLTYLGKSYGTSIGVEYARQFPDSVGRLVLDGAIDPALDDRDVLLGQAAGFELALSRFIEACLADGCSLGTSADDVRSLISGVLERSDDDPLPTAARPLTQSLAIYGIIGPLYWPPEQGYDLLQSALAQADAGDGTALLQLADVYLQRGPDGTYASNQWDIFTPVSCLDRPGDWSPADVEQSLPEFTAASPVLGESLAWGLLACTNWPIPSDGLPAPVAAAGADPVLVVGTTGDPATPYEWSVALTEQLDSGVLLTYEGSPHTAYRKGSACVDGIVNAYLIEGKVPANGTRCD